MTTIKILSLRTLLLMSIVLLGACSNNNEEPEPSINYEMAMLRTFNYVTADISLDFYMDDALTIEGVAYAFGSLSEFKFEEGSNSVTHSIRVNDGDEVFSTELDVVADASYLSAVIGPLSGGGKVIIANNDLTTPATGNIRLRFLHAYNNEGAVDIYVGGREASNKLVNNLEYGELSDYYEIAVDDINSNFVLTKTGVAPNVDTDLIQSTDNDSHEAGDIYLDVFAPKTIDPTSALSWYTPKQ